MQSALDAKKVEETKPDDARSSTSSFELIDDSELTSEAVHERTVTDEKVQAVSQLPTGKLSYSALQ